MALILVSGRPLDKLGMVKCDGHEMKAATKKENQVTLLRQI